jgi:hypothetical protein
MKNSESSRAFVIDPHKSGLADKLASSRKTRSARNRYHGFANR